MGKRERKVTRIRPRGTAASGKAILLNLEAELIERVDEQCKLFSLTRSAFLVALLRKHFNLPSLFDLGETKKEE